MTPEKKAALERAGFREGTIQEFLGLSDEETAEVDALVAAIVLAEDDEFEEIIGTFEIPPPSCPTCGEYAGADCGEPCFLVTWTRGPGDPPGIGPVYHQRCYP